MRKKNFTVFYWPCYAHWSVNSQTLTLTGRVLDEKGAPIPYASIIIKGKTKSGTTSDPDGKFTIAAAKGSVIVVSAINYASHEVTVGVQRLQ